MIGKIFHRVYTGIDGEKSFSISYNPLKKSWSSSSSQGLAIHVIPSDLCLIKIEQAFTKSISKIRSYYGLEIENKFGGFPFDVSLVGDRVFIAIYRDSKAKNYTHIELEPFALARLLSLITDEGILIDIGRRKTTFVQIEGRLLKSYRVIMQGCNYLTDLVSQKRGISAEEAESLLFEKGLELEEVREGLDFILKQSGYRLNDTKVLLSGGGAYLKGISEIFSNIIENKLCSPELSSAFGAAMKYAVNNPYPSFQFKTMSKEELRKAGIALAASLALFFVTILAIDNVFSVKNLKETERAEFKKTFPNTPIVSLHEQIMAKVTTGDKYELTKKLKELSILIEPGMKIISIDYNEGIIRLKGEADSLLTSKIKAKNIKQTAKGTVEFEVELR